MAKKVKLLHKESGITKNGAYGFSYTYLFFGWFVPLFRGELEIALYHFVFTFFTFGFWQLIASFLYNKQYMTRMLISGWILAGTEEENKKAKLALSVMD